jgi:hypothetical protein
LAAAKSFQEKLEGWDFWKGYVREGGGKEEGGRREGGGRERERGREEGGRREERGRCRQHFVNGRALGSASGLMRGGRGRKREEEGGRREPGGSREEGRKEATE